MKAGPFLLTLALVLAAPLAFAAEHGRSHRLRFDVLARSTDLGWLLGDGEARVGGDGGVLRDARLYSARLTLHPVMIEAVREQRASGWATWLSGGLYLYSDENCELGFRFVGGGDAVAREHYAVLNFTAEF